MFCSSLSVGMMTVTLAWLEVIAVITSRTRIYKAVVNLVILIRVATQCVVLTLAILADLQKPG